MRLLPDGPAGTVPRTLSCWIHLHLHHSTKTYPEGPFHGVLCCVERCCEVHGRPIPRRGLRWWRSYRRPGARGAPGLIIISASSHWSPGPSGRGLGISGSGHWRGPLNDPSLNWRSVLVVWDWHHCVHASLHQRHHWHEIQKTGLINPSTQWHKNHTAILRRHHWIMSLLIWSLRPCWSHPCCPAVLSQLPGPSHLPSRHLLLDELATEWQ